MQIHRNVHETTSLSLVSVLKGLLDHCGFIFNVAGSLSYTITCLEKSAAMIWHHGDKDWTVRENDYTIYTGHIYSTYIIWSFSISRWNRKSGFILFSAVGSLYQLLKLFIWFNFKYKINVCFSSQCTQSWIISLCELCHYSVLYVHVYETVCESDRGCVSAD